MFQVLVVCVVHFVAVIVRRVAIIGPGLAVCIARYQNSLLTRVRTYWLAVWIRADTFVSQMSVSQLGVCPAQLWVLFPAARMAVLGALQRDGAKMVSVQRMRHVHTTVCIFLSCRAGGCRAFYVGFGLPFAVISSCIEGDYYLASSVFYAWFPMVGLVAVGVQESDMLPMMHTLVFVAGHGACLFEHRGCADRGRARQDSLCQDPVLDVRWCFLFFLHILHPSAQRRAHDAMHARGPSRFLTCIFRRLGLPFISTA